MSNIAIVHNSIDGHAELQAEAAFRSVQSARPLDAYLYTTENIEGPGPAPLNRVGSFIAAMAASFRVKPPHAPCQGDIETAEPMAAASRKSPAHSSGAGAYSVVHYRKTEVS